jgi:light-regulated signal transduction histidine kinase (bacteriophytochrome)
MEVDAIAQIDHVRSDFEQFARTASHSLAEPLALTAGYARLLSDRYRGELDADARRFLQAILDAVDGMQSRLDDLRAYSRVTTRGGPFQAVDVGVAAREAVAALGDAVDATSASIEIDEMPTIEADPDQLVQLFRALLSNALRFRSGARPAVRIEAERDGEQWLFAVTDNGVGVPEIDRERIFGMFETGTRQGPGSSNGAGLAISRRIVERHDGEISVVPADGGGSAFVFTLPDRHAGER